MKYFILCLFFLGFYGCSDSNNSVSTIMLNDHEITVSFLNKLQPDTAIIPLSSLVEGCEFVQLEYAKEALFKPWKTKITEKYIGIFPLENSADMSYKLFSRSGKFLGKVGSVGQGPGEYIAVCDDIIDEKNEMVYLAPFYSGDKILAYNTSGKFLKNITMPRFIHCPMLSLFDDTLTVVYIADSMNQSMVTQINIHTGQVLNEFPTQIPQIEYHNIYNARNMRDVFDIASVGFDTIYHIDIANHSVKPIFTMSDNSSEKSILQLHYQLNKDLVWTTVLRKGLLGTKAVITDMKNKRSSWAKVKNDYLGNLDVPISLGFNDFSNGYFVYNIQPEQLIEDIERRLTESDCTEQDRQRLQHILSTIEKDGNNVVFFGKLKSEVNARLF